MEVGLATVTYNVSCSTYLQIVYWTEQHSRYIYGNVALTHNRNIPPTQVRLQLLRSRKTIVPCHKLSRRYHMRLLLIIQLQLTILIGTVGEEHSVVTFSQFLQRHIRSQSYVTKETQTRIFRSLCERINDVLDLWMIRRNSEAGM